MVTVSERATARLLEQRHAADLDGEADGSASPPARAGNGYWSPIKRAKTIRSLTTRLFETNDGGVLWLAT